MDARRLVLTTTVALLAAAAPAAAQDPLPVPTPPPVKGTLSLSAPTIGSAQGQAVALRGDRIKVSGVLRPYVAGQRVAVRLRQNGKAYRRKVVPIRPGAGGVGVYAARLRLTRAGATTVQAIHRGTKQLAPAKAHRNVAVAVPALTYGSSGPLVELFQRRLRAIRFAVAVTGVYDDRTARGVIAWRKIAGMARLGSADGTVIRKVLAGKGAWKVRHPRAGHHVEADVSQGVLALVDGKRLVRTFHTSPGKPSTPTIIGTFRFYLKTIGTNSHGMVDSSYFIRGYAIHGYASVPVFNASHGCLRIPIPDARYVYNWVRIGDKIFVEP